MADGKTHKTIGAFGGTVASLIFNGQKGTPNLSLIYMAGGATGGIMGGRLADIIDIPDSPFHRSFGHSVSINGIAYLNKRTKKIFQDCLDYLIQKANKFINEGNKILVIVQSRISNTKAFGLFCPIKLSWARMPKMNISSDWKKKSLN